MFQRFDTSEFIRSHGREPRGVGQWGFGIRENADPCNDQDTIWTGELSYTDAKHYAVAELRRRGFERPRTLYVMP